MKKYALIVIFTFLCSSLYAQGGYIGFNGGVSMPQYNVDPTGPRAWAQDGLNFNLSLGYLYTPNLGIAALVTYSPQPFDNTNFDAGLFQPSEWKIGAALMGGLISVPAGPISLDIRALAGVGYSTSPDFTIPPQAAAPVEDYAFAFDLGAGLRIAAGPHMYLLLNADYLSTNPDFQNHPWSGTQWLPEKLDMFNLTLGLGFAIP